MSELPRFTMKSSLSLMGKVKRKQENQIKM